MADGQDREWLSPLPSAFLVLPLSVALAAFSPESVGSVEQALLQGRICCWAGTASGWLLGMHHSQVSCLVWACSPIWFDSNC